MSGWFDGWTPNQKVAITSLFLILLTVGSLAIAGVPSDIIFEILNFSERFMDRDEVWVAIEEYLDQDVGGSPWQTEKTCDFLISRLNVSGTLYFYMLNGTSGKLWDYSTSLEYIMEKSWGNLTNGGVIVTHGPGQTWTVDAKIDSQSTDVTWISDWSLTFKAKNSLNAWMIDIGATHHRTKLSGLHIDGNKANQANPNGLKPTGIGFRADDVTIENFYVHDCRRDGIIATGVGLDNAVIKNGILKDNGWNGISGGDISSGTIEDVWVSGSGDIGIQLGADAERVSIINCKIFDNNATDGSSNSNWGISLEYGGPTSGKYIIKNNHFWGLHKRHLVAETNARSVVIEGNHFESCNESAWHASGIEVKVRGDSSDSPSEYLISNNIFDQLNGMYAVDCWQFNGSIKIQDNHIVYNSTETGNPIAINVDNSLAGKGEDVTVQDNTIKLPSSGTNKGIYVNNVSDGIIGGNRITGAGIAIDIFANADDWLIEGNKVDTTTGLRIQAASCDRTAVDSNDFYGSGTDVSDSGTNTRYGGNKDQTGNWDENVVP